MDEALLILRIVVGLSLFAHGAQKLFGAFGGPGIRGVAGWLGSLGFRPPAFWAVVAGLVETAGGLLLAFGFLSPLGSFAIAASMVTAIVVVHWPRGFFVSAGGIEHPLGNLAVVLALVLSGPGRYSLDAIFGIALPAPATAIAAAVIVAAGLIVALASRKPLPAGQATG